MKSLVIGTAGHIDHGKSSLVQALTGIDPDRLKEEKSRGITIDLGFAHWTAGDVHLAFVDVPGHERFVRNMLAGAGGIDGVLLVVAADESIMPQTREHFEICRLLGIRHAVVALTKSDLVDAETLQLVRLEVADLVTGSPFEGAPLVPVSVRTGDGLDDLRRALVALAAATSPRAGGGAARLPIDRAFTMKGFGTVVTGTLASGRIRSDQELVLLPGGRPIKVRGVQVHGQTRDEAWAGERVALNVAGMDVQDVSRGQALVQPGAFEPSRVLDARIELLGSARPLKHGTRVRFHQGTAEVMGRVAVLPGESSEGIRPGAIAFVRIRLEAPATLTRGDRFILRAYSPVVTIGGGLVLDPHAPRAGIRVASAMQRFERLEPHGPRESPDDAAIALMVEDRGIAGLPARELTPRAGVAPRAVPGTVERLRASGLVDDIDGTLFVPGLRARLAERLEAIVREHHRQQPLSEGLPREEGRERLFGRAAPVLFERVLADLAAAGAVSGRDRLAASGHHVSLTSEEEHARSAIERALLDGGLKPPEPAALAATHGLEPAVAERILALLVRQKVLVRIETIYFHQAALERLKQDVRALKSKTAGSVDVAAFKERYDISRKFAIPLLEYLDRERVTRRVGDKRVVL